MQPTTKLPKVGTTIFTVMSQLAAEHGAVNLGQGFPDFSAPQRLIDETAKAMAAGLNQYPPMTGVAPLRQAIAQKSLDLYGATIDPDTEITVTSGATEAIFNAIHAVVRAGEKSSCSTRPMTATSRRSSLPVPRPCTCRWTRRPSLWTGTACARQSPRAPAC